MANSVEDALARASNEQREKALAVIAEAQRKIQLVDTSGDKSAAAESEIKNYESVIENAKRDMPNEVQSTMQSVDSIAPPMATPSPNQQYDSTPIELNPDTAGKIESIQRGGGNNYLYPGGNAVDRAMSRPEQGGPDNQSQQQELGR